MNNATTWALGAALLCCSNILFAQQVNPSWYIQPSIGAVEADLEFGSDEREYSAGLRFGRPVAQHWDVQIGASHARVETGAFNYRQTLVGADALLLMSRNRFRPFLLVGVGAQRDKVDNPFRRARGTSPYLSGGLGFQMDLTNRLAMQADLRTVRGHLRHDEAFGFERSNNKYLTVGMNYALSPPPAFVTQTTTMTIAEPARMVQEPPPPPAPTPPPPAPARFEKVTLSATELFEFDSATLRMPQPRLDEIAAALSADPSITDVDITGYADRLGSDKYNQKLSERRANAVRAYLVSKGIDGARLKAYGKGETNPVVTCTNKNRAALIKCLEPNRRVEVEQIAIERRVLQ